jgi:hypothetical protein
MLRSVLLSLLALSACGDDESPAETPQSCTPTAVACEDQAVLELNLQSDSAPGLIDNAPSGSGFNTHVDATAGGAFTTTPDSYVYARFTDEGLVKLPISDEASLASTAWDIAFRRFVIRINSGSSGPGCIQAARLPDATTFDDVVAAPAGPYRTDVYFTDSCEMIADGSGLGTPATALSGFWEYPGCVKMTYLVYVLTLADGRHVKLTVTHYYDEAAQADCQTTDQTTSSGSGNIRMRWAFLD